MKNKLYDILKNPANKVIAVDLDGVLCRGEFWGEGEPEPIRENIDYFNSLYKKGAHIVIYTARQPEHFAITNAWLIKHGVMNHGINMQKKPGADCYIDDKALNLEDLKEEA